MSAVEKKILTSPIGVVSFPYLFKLRANNQEGSAAVPKVEVCLILDADPKDANHPADAAMRQAIRDAWVAKFPKIDFKFFALDKYPYRVIGTKPNDSTHYPPEFEGKILVRFASSKLIPVVGARRQVLTDVDVYAGCKARVLYDAFATNAGGTNRVCLGLQVFQKAGEGTPLAGVRATADDLPDDLPDDGTSEF